jgi:hypothetical protein
MHAWIPLERERARCSTELERLEAVSLVVCGGPATTDWWHTQTMRAVGAARERLLRAEAACCTAATALGQAKLQRRVLEKLEERFARAAMERRASRLRSELDEANAAARAVAIERAP